MQITQIPAFAPYSWYCLKHHAPLQCVFLLLTYLQHNRQSQHAHLARYYVDEVIDVFTSKERLVVPENSNRKIVGTEAKSETKPRSPAWSILVDLRYKIDISPHAKPPLFKPTVPIRCQPVPSALALHTISLSIGEKPHEAVTQEAKSGPGIVETSRASTTEPRLSSTRSTTVNDPHVNQINPTDLEQLLDLSHMDTWSSDSLSKVPEDFLLAHEDFLDFDNNLHMHDSLGHASYA